jgi:hypothetical protein
MLGIQHYMIYPRSLSLFSVYVCCVTKFGQNYFPKGFPHDTTVPRIRASWSLGPLYMGSEMTKTMVLDSSYSYHLP